MSKQTFNPVWRGFACLVALLILLPAMMPVAVWAAEGEQEIVIRTEEDFREFARDASYDAWSRGKTVSLEADLDFTGEDFAPVSTFGGVFEGNGHTIAVSLTEDGSHQGVFRYLQEGGVIRRLAVKGTVSPAGSQSDIGGVVGNNHGKITECSFAGSINGKSNTGGIAGINETTGEIYACTVSGDIQGEHYTGGIAGQNLGSISSCTNQGSVNTAAVEYERDPAGLDISELNSTENLNTTTDTGGIAGYSSGVLLGCTNEGEIGYPHIGYNAGGIAGRSSGRLEGCENRGAVHGRKDVGGVAGQLVPDIILQFSPDTLSQLEGEIHTLQQQTQDLLTQTENSVSHLTSSLQAISHAAEQAGDSAQDLSGQAVEWANGNLEELNTAAALLFDTLSQTAPLMEDLSTVSDTVSEGLKEGKRVFLSLGEMSSLSDDVMLDMEKVFESLQAAVADGSRGAAEIAAGLEKLRDAVTAGDTGDIQEAIELIAQGSQELRDALDTLRQSLSALKEIVDSLPDGGDLSQIWEAALPLLNDALNAVQNMAGAAQTIQEGIAMLPSDFQVDWAVMKEALAEIAAGLGSFHDAAGDMDHTFQYGIETLEDLRQVSGEAGDAAQEMAGVLEHFHQAFAQLSSFLSDFGSLLQGLAQNDPIEFQGFDSDYQEASDRLFSSLSAISQQVESLGSGAQANEEAVFQSLRQIAAQFDVILDLTLEAISSSGEEDTPVYEDTTEEDIHAITMGKAENCLNSGAVSGDVNVGGVAGSMAIEYDLDPEDDISQNGEKSRHFHFETKAILQSCVNRGSVTAKKDCAGGLVGRMDLGMVYDCGGYGKVASTDGDYVGGIAGKASSTIWQSYAKCSLSGGSYVGGIAGYGGQVRDCRSLVEIPQAAEKYGAIAGERDEDGTFCGNYFVSNTLAGIDGVSYQGIAEPMEYEAFLQLEGLPEDFQHFTLTYMIDGAVVETVPFQYGEDLSSHTPPEIPEKEGNYGVWEECDDTYMTFDTVLEAVYTPYTTTVTGSEQRDEIHQVFLLEGNFGSDTALSAEKTEPEELLEQWEISLSGEGVKPDGSYTLRFMPPESNREIVLYSLEDGKREEIPYKQDGSYLVFQMAGDHLTLGVGERSPLGWIIGVAGGGVLAIGIILFFVLRKKRKK